MIRSLPRLMLARRVRVARPRMGRDRKPGDVITDDAVLVAAYATCRSYLQSHRGGWGLLSVALPSELGRHVDASMALAVYADDLADDVDLSPALRSERFSEWRDLLGAVDNGDERPGDLDWSVCRAFAHTMSTCGISQASVDVHLDALDADLTFDGFATYAELHRYVEAVLGEPMAWLNHLFDGAAREAARKARAVGAAWWLTDMLTDLREDLALGRLYLPLEDLQRFEVGREEIERGALQRNTTERLRALVLFEAARARALQEEGVGWASLVAPVARAAAQLIETDCKRRLTQIEQCGGDLFGRPAGNGSAVGNGSVVGAVSPRSRPRRDRRPTAGAANGSAARTPPATVPRHVGIIMDGNRRWSLQHGVPIRVGHEMGAEAVRKMGVRVLSPEYDRFRGVDYVSIYGLSTENWSRPPEELNDLFDIYADVARDQLRMFDDNNVRVRFLGRTHGLPAYVRNAIEIAEERTAANDGGTLAVCLNYGGQTEIIDAVNAMVAARVSSRDLSTKDLDEFLYAPDIPPLDLVIRTGGDQRLSNFMLWRAAYAELVFLPTLWPDFTAEELMLVLDDYATRARRFGS